MNNKQVKLDDHTYKCLLEICPRKDAIGVQTTLTKMIIEAFNKKK